MTSQLVVGPDHDGDVHVDRDEREEVHEEDEEHSCKGRVSYEHLGVVVLTEHHLQACLSRLGDAVEQDFILAEEHVAGDDEGDEEERKDRGVTHEMGLGPADSLE